MKRETQPGDIVIDFTPIPEGTLVQVGLVVSKEIAEALLDAAPEDSEAESAPTSACAASNCASKVSKAKFDAGYGQIDFGRKKPHQIF